MQFRAEWVYTVGREREAPRTEREWRVGRELACILSRRDPITWESRDVLG